MSSKRAQRRKACDGKHQHESFQQAMSHIASIRYNGTSGEGKGYTLTAYKCSFCRNWHVGHRKSK